MWVQGRIALVAVALALSIALVILLARPGSFRRLLDLRIRGLWLLWVAAGIQALSKADPAWAAPLLEPRGGTMPELAIWFCGLAFTVANVRHASRAVSASLMVFAAGFSMNSLTTLLNGGMPFSADAARKAGFAEAAIAEPAHHYQVITDDTWLPYLADIVPLAPLDAVISIGDLLLVASLIGLIVAFAWPRDRSPEPTTANEPASTSGAEPAPDHSRLTKGGIHA